VNVRERSYDALGWWSLVEHLGVDLWKLQPALVRAGGFGDSTRPYALAVSSSPGTLATDWGSTLAQSAPLGPRWNLDGPGMTQRAEPTAVVADGGEFAHGVDTAGGYERAMDISADVITVRSKHTVEGFLRDGAGTDRPIPNNESYCARPEGCQCPGGRDLPYPPITPGVGKIGFADPVEMGAVVITGRSLEDECPKPRNDACRVLAQAGVAGTVGTPGIFQFVVDRPLPNGAHFWSCIYIGEKPDPEDPTHEIPTGKAASLNLAAYPRTKRSTLLRNVSEFLRKGGYQLIHIDGADLAGIVRGSNGGAAIQMLIGKNTALLSGGGGESDTRQLAAQVARVLR
jgi:hypothetical protein